MGLRQLKKINVKVNNNFSFKTGNILVRKDVEFDIVCFAFVS